MPSPNRGSRGRMRPVTPNSPCPVCEKPDWCLVAPDGSAALCQRVESGKRCDDAGWLHRLTDPPPATRKSAAVKDWPAAAARLAKGFTPARRRELAARLGLPAEVFDALPLVGVIGATTNGVTFTFPECDASGTVVGILRRFPDGAKKAMPGSKRGLCLPTGWRDRSGPVFVVEGPSDVLAMTSAGLASVGRPSANGGAKLLAELFRGWPADRNIILVGENDRKPNGRWPGKDGAEAVVRHLARKLRRTVTVAFPPDGAKDVREWLTRADRGDAPWLDRGTELSAHLSATAQTTGASGESPPFDAPADRRRIEVTDHEYEVNDLAAGALAKTSRLYQRSGSLVRVIEQDADSPGDAAVRRSQGAPVVSDLSRASLREELTRVCEFYRVKESSNGSREEVVPPPDFCVGAVWERKAWAGVPPLRAVVPHPVLLPDGRLLVADGYDPGSGLYLHSAGDLPLSVPDEPTREDAVAAVSVLLDVVCDFPFAVGEHQAAWLASLLTPAAWFAFAGPAPLFLVDGNCRGVGKGLLADTAGLILTGRRFCVMSYDPDPTELRKRITALAAEGERLVLLDNLTGKIGNGTLDAALTGESWRDRILGVSRMWNGPLNVVWYATGNNVVLCGDTPRRTCQIRLETEMENPEERTGLKRPKLREFVLAERPRLLSAVLTVLRAWVVAGRPNDPSLKPWGSYEGWSDVVRQCVVWAGLSDPGLARMSVTAAADPAREAMAVLFARMEAAEKQKGDGDKKGFTAGELVERAKQDIELRGAVEDLCGRLDSRVVGNRLKHFCRTPIAGRYLDRGGVDHQAVRWVIRPVAEFRRRAESNGTDSPDSPDSPAVGRSSPVRGESGESGESVSFKSSEVPRGRADQATDRNGRALRGGAAAAGEPDPFADGGEVSPWF